MITHEHENGKQQKAQALTPVREHLWLVVLCSILGVALPMVAGWWVEWPLIEVNIFPTNDWTLPILVMVVLPVTIGAFLFCFAFRTWWVAVFAGVAWYLSFILSMAVHQYVLSGYTVLTGLSGYIELTWMPILFSMLLGAACAYPLVKWRTSRK